jgi:hypothetical protein
VAIRDDREALRAQIATLEAEVRRLTAGEATAARERDDARAELERVTQERDALQAELARLRPRVPSSPDPRQSAFSKLVPLIAAALLIVGVALAIALSERAAPVTAEPAPPSASEEPEPSEPAAPAPPPPELPLDDLVRIRYCLDDFDARMRLFLVAVDHVDGEDLFRRANFCEHDLARLGPLPSPLGPAVQQYRAVLPTVPDIVRRVQAGHRSRWSKSRTASIRRTSSPTPPRTGPSSSPGAAPPRWCAASSGRPSLSTRTAPKRPPRGARRPA